MAEDLLRTKVHELIKDNGDRERLFDALRHYQGEQDLSRLMKEMYDVLNEPNKLELFDHMRPLILLHHQIEYSQLMPCLPAIKSRIVRLHKRRGESLGFAVRGGVEHGVGVYVTDVKSGSQADKQGLLIGDEILGVNGFTISEAIHEDVLSLIKSKEDIVLRVTHIGMVPSKEDLRSEVNWKICGKKTQDELANHETPRDLKIFIDSSGHHSLGCGILSGPPHLPGIFVERVRPGSLAEEVNLEPGDQILEVNGTTFQRTTHKEAVLALVSSRQLNITIRKGVGLVLMNQIPGVTTTTQSNSINSNGAGSLASSTSSQRQEWQRSNTTPTPFARDSAVSLSSSTSTTHSLNARNQSRSSEPVDFETERQSDYSPSSPEFTFPPPSSSLVTTKAEVNTDKRSSSSSSNFSFHEINDEMRDLDVDDPTDKSVGSEIREEILSRFGSSQRPSPLSGAAAIMQQRKLGNAKTPDLLGYGEDYQYNESVSNKVYDMFTIMELDGRPLHSLIYKKKMDLGVNLEGGLGSPLNGKILVATLYGDGVASKCERMRVGDQLMAVNGTKLVDVTVTKAEMLIQDATMSLSTPSVELVFCSSTLVNEEESMTYF